jgi:hypothetical protein
VNTIINIRVTGISWSSDRWNIQYLYCELYWDTEYCSRSVPSFPTYYTWRWKQLFLRNLPKQLPDYLFFLIFR